MKKLIIAVLLLGFLQQASAQVRRHARMPVNRNTDSLQLQTGDSSAQANKMNRKELWMQLDLTKEQRGKMKEIMKDAKAKKEAIQNDGTLTEDQKAAKLKGIKKETALKTGEVLTPEQREQWKKLRKEQAQNRPKDKSAPQSEMKEEDLQMEQ